MQGVHSKMNFEPSDLHHLRAAEGWLELGNHLEANEELENITAQLRAHPAVLLLRWNVSAMAKKWGVCVELAQELTKLSPDLEQGWGNFGNSLYWAGQTQEAYVCVKPVLDRFPKNPILRYNLACYACQLGHLEEAMFWLEKAFEVGDPKRLKRMALEDPDLEPLRKSLGQI